MPRSFVTLPLLLPLLLALLLALELLGGPAHARGAPVPQDDRDSPPPEKTTGTITGKISADLDGWLGTDGPRGARAVVAHFLDAAGRDRAPYDRALDGWVAEIRARDAKESASPAARAATLRAVLFGENGFDASADLTDLENLYPDRIVERRRGYCLGLTAVLLDLCDRLGWSAEAVSAPRHTFLRLTGEDPVNFETTRAGASEPDEWYRARFAIGEEPATLRALDSRRLAGHLLSNVAFARLERGEIAAARGLIYRSLRLDPEIVEARTNRGVCDAREKKYESALEAFDETLERWPGDPLTRLNRVNALLPLGRTDEAVRELVGLLEKHPVLTTLTRRAEEVRDQLDVHHHWTARQRVSMALVRQVERTRSRIPGLRATYYRGTGHEDPLLHRVDRDLSFQWGWDGPGGNVPSDRFSARWAGWLTVPADDEYTFFITCSDGIRLWIDGRLVIDAWTRANDNFPMGSIELLEGTHDLRIEYFESVGQAGLKVILTSEKEDKPFDLPDLLASPGADPGSGGSR